MQLLRDVRDTLKDEIWITSRQFANFLGFEFNLIFYEEN